MFLVCDPQCRGPEHAAFNAAFLASLRAGFTQLPVAFYAEAGHLRLVEQLLREQAVERIELRPIEVPPRHRGGARRLIADLGLHARMLEETAARGWSDAVFTSITTTGLLALELLARRDGPRCTIVPHAILEKAGERGGTWFPHVLSAASPGRLRLLVLSESILKSLRESGIALELETVAIEHPYFFPALGPPEPFRGGRVRFGSIGQAHRSRGLGALIRLARVVKAAPGGEWASFVHIGPVTDPELAAQAEGLVEFPAHHGFLDRREFQRKISEIDYAVFCFPPGSYRLNVSGAIFDAMAHGKPVLAIENAYFRHIFDLTSAEAKRRSGPEVGGEVASIGLLAQGESELQAALKQIVAAPPRAEYLAQREALVAARRMFSPERVASQLQRVWARTGG